MRIFRSTILFSLIFILFPGMVSSDFLSPFADSPVGQTVTATGRLLIANRRGEERRYQVLFGTDTGIRLIRANVLPKIIKPEFIGRPIKITATIKTTKAKPGHMPTRFLNVKKIELI